MPGAIAYRAGGMLELVTHRNALRETAFGMIRFPGQPATGHERSVHVADYAIRFTLTGDWLSNNLLRQASCALGYHPEQTTTRARANALAAMLVETEPSEVIVAAIKPATRGDGIIIRLLAPGQRGKSVVLRCLRHAVTEAWLCDARERDIERLEVRPEGVRLSMPGSIATLRVANKAR
jgi:alpha-mannosidase